MSLYLKYRPKELSQIKGNADVVATIEKMVENLETCPHTFLLHGGTGCGKTTLGRIIANKLGCKGIDFTEVDTADFRGIDSVREIRKNAQYSPMEGRCRVWVLDEIHKMTGDAQNALLKILEDTPKHVYFILCTTEPQKLIPTIRGRCIELQVKPLNETELYTLLRGVVRSEGDKLEREVFDQIIQDSQGHPRNALQILEQVLSAEPDRRMEVATRTAALQSQSIELCRALMKRSSWKEVSTILNGLKEEEPENVRRVVMGYAQSVLLKKDETLAGFILEEFVEPFYNSGFPGLTLACYRVTKG